MKSCRFLQMAALLLAAAVVPACHVSSGPASTSPPPGTGTTFKAAMLSGRQEVPPDISAGTGNATIVIDSNQTSMTVTVNVSGLLNITAAHIHVADPGVDGPIIFPLASGPFSSPLVLTLDQSNLTAAGTVATFADAVAAIQAGRTYVNVHTMVFPEGEIRGQVGPTRVQAALNGVQEVPPNLTPGNGTFSLTMNNDQTAMTFTLSVSALSNITAAHIHAGPTGVDGPIFFTLASTSFVPPLTGTLTSTNFMPLSTPGFNTFDEAVDGILSGLTYVNVHTASFPDGEIRGQISSTPGLTSGTSRTTR